MTDLIIRIRTASSGPVIELAGDLDHDTAPQLRAQLLHLTLQAGQVVVIDLGGIAFCDSSGITALIACRNHALAAHAGIALAAVPDRVSRIFRIVGLSQVFTAHPTVQAATAAWNLTGGGDSSPCRQP